MLGDLWNPALDNRVWVRPVGRSGQPDFCWNELAHGTCETKAHLTYFPNRGIPPSCGGARRGRIVGP